MHEHTHDHHSHDELDEEGYTMEDFVAWHNEQHTGEGYEIETFLEWHDTLHANATLDSFIEWHGLHHDHHQPCNNCTIIECNNTNAANQTAPIDLEFFSEVDENQQIIMDMLELLLN